MGPKCCEYCGEYHEEDEDGLFPGRPWPTRCIDVDDIRDRQALDESAYGIKSE